MPFRDRVNAFVARHEVAWELGFAGLAIVFVMLGFVQPTPASHQTIFMIEWAITIVFAIEFTLRLWASHDRRHHFRAHAVDLISLIPPVRWLRPLRLLRLLRLVRAFAGVSRAMAALPRFAMHRGLILLVASWLAVMVITAIAIYVAEHDRNPGFDDPFDALWWGVGTLSTAGYGDVYPLTQEGRIAAMILMLLGIGLFSAITASVTSYFLSSGRDAGLAEELERLEAMAQRGSLTDEEYRIAKVAILGLSDDAMGR